VLGEANGVTLTWRSYDIAHVIRSSDCAFALRAVNRGAVASVAPFSTVESVNETENEIMSSEMI
jgi:hypothetical protein